MAAFNARRLLSMRGISQTCAERQIGTTPSSNAGESCRRKAKVSLSFPKFIRNETPYRIGQWIVLGTISVETARMMARLYATARLYINFFQPSFKLKEKPLEGAKVVKRYLLRIPRIADRCSD
jgi:hypothetical protein